MRAHVLEGYISMPELRGNQMFCVCRTFRQARQTSRTLNGTSTAHLVPKLPLGTAVGDDAESVRWRLRERVSGPDGDDAGDELGDRALGGGG